MAKTSAKKALRNDMVINLKNSLSYLKDYLSDKKLNSRIEKASKLLIKGIKRKKNNKNNLQKTEITEKERISANSIKLPKKPLIKKVEANKVEETITATAMTTNEQSNTITETKPRTPRSRKVNVQK